MILLLLAALDGTIEDHLRALRDDDIERRQAAVESLASLGEGSLGAIREARRDADPETRARLAEIESRIEADVRRRTFPGGPEVLGLKAALSARWDADREAVRFEMTILNVAAGDAGVVEPRGWDTSVPGWSRSTNWSRLRLQVQAVRVENDGRIGGGGAMATFGCGGRRVPPPLLRLAPGESRGSEPIELRRGTDARSLQLRPGLYKARAVYFAKKLLPGAAEDLETPWIEFTVPE